MSKQIALENYYFLEQLPIVRDLMERNEKLKRKNKELKRLVHAISANIPLLGGNTKEKWIKKERKEVDENVPLDVDVVCVKMENGDDDEVIVIVPPAKNNIVYEISEVDESIKLDVIENAEEEAEEEEAEEEEAEEEEAEEEEAEEEEAEEEEAEEEEAEEEEAEEEEAEEEGGVRDSDEIATAEEEVYEVIIKGKAYYTTNEKNGVIYGVDKDGDVSEEVGVYVDGKPTFKK
jgi:hypothetical protein